MPAPLAAQSGAAGRQRDGASQRRRRRQRPGQPRPPPSAVPAEHHQHPPCVHSLPYRRRAAAPADNTFRLPDFPLSGAPGGVSYVVMRTPSEIDPDVATVVAAQRGDRRALDVLAAAYLPLVYNIVGRAMNGHPDVDDVVQETMLRAVRGVGEVRDPAAFRSWLVAIAIRQVRDSYRDRLAQPPTVESDAPSPDFADTTIERLGLSGQRLETAEATRWLDDEDGQVLALWWQEAAGKLSRADLAVALELSPAHAAVRVARMKERLVTSRTVVRALRRVPLVPEPGGDHGRVEPRAEPAVAQAAGPARQGLPVVPGRHRRDDSGRAPARRAAAGRGAGRLAGATRYLAAGQSAGQLPGRLGAAERGASGSGGGGGSHAGGSGGRGRRAARVTRHARHTRVLAKASAAVQPKLIAASVALVTCAAGGTLAVVHAHQKAAPAALSVAAPRPTPRAALPVPPVTHTSRPKKHPTHKPSPSPSSAPRPGHRHQPAEGRRHLECRRRQPGPGRIRGVLVLRLGRDPQRHHRAGRRGLRPDDLGRVGRHDGHAGPG